MIKTADNIQQMLCMRERSREDENKNKDNLVAEETSAEIDYACFFWLEQTLANDTETTPLH